MVPDVLKAVMTHHVAKVVLKAAVMVVAAEVAVVAAGVVATGPVRVNAWMPTANP